MPKIQDCSRGKHRFGLGRLALLVAAYQNCRQPVPKAHRWQQLISLGLALLLLGVVAFATQTPVATAASTPTTPAPKQVKGNIVPYPANRPHVSYFKIYYVTYTVDDNWGICNPNGNPNGYCTLRNAIYQASIDGHGTNQDLILLTSGTTYTLGSQFSMYPSLPQLPDYVDISVNSDRSCNPLTAFITLAGYPSNVYDGLTLGNHDYINDVNFFGFTDGTGYVVNGSYNTITCAFATDDSDGIDINPGASYNQIGGVFGNQNHTIFGAYGLEVVVAGNIGSNIAITGPNTHDNIVSDVGIGYAQNLALTTPSNYGVYITKGATNNFIGGFAGFGNIISNSMNGVFLKDSNTSGNKILGNYIGTDVSGLNAVANTNTGVVLINGANNNVIGLSNNGNVISGNGYDGIAILGGGTNSNKVQANYIGVKADGSGPLYNGTSSGSGSDQGYCNPSGSAVQAERCNAIFIGNLGYGTPSGNIIGGIGTKGEGNVLAAGGCSGYPAGVLIDQADSNYVQGNSIGVLITNSSITAYPTVVGIGIQNGASNNQIGGDRSQGQGNLIGNVSNSGVSINNEAYGGGSPVGPLTGNRIQGNAIGVDFIGNPDPKLAVQSAGIQVLGKGAVTKNVIGVDADAATIVPFQGNLIGNVTTGGKNGIVFAAGSNADSNQVNGNYIGVKADDSEVTSNLITGIAINGANDTRVIGNYVGGAINFGIELSGAVNTTVSGNYIGTNSTGANLRNSIGIEVDNGSHNNTLFQNLVGYNKFDGVKIGTDSHDSTTNQNTVSQNSIFGSAGVLGININYLNSNGIVGGSDSGPNNQAEIPTLTAATFDSGAKTLTISGTANPNSTVEVFLADANKQGQVYIGTISASTVGTTGNFNNISLNLPSGFTIPSNPQIVATSTLTTPANRAGSTSQFSATIAVTVTTPPPPAPGNNGYTYNLPLLSNNATTAVGKTTTYVTLQNLSITSTANITVQYYDIATGTPTSNHDSFQLAAKGQTAPNLSVSAGTSYGAIVSSDQPLNLVVAEGLPTGGSAYNVSAATAATLYSPLAFNGQYGFTTSIIVFNGGTSTSTGTIQFYDESGNLVSAATQNFSIPAHASQAFNQAATNSGLNANHGYWAKISATNSSDQLTAQVIEFGPSNFVATFNAVVHSQLSNALFAPATFDGQFGFVTGMGFANPNGATATGNIKYYDKNGTLLLTQPISIPANGSIGVFQPGVSGLPTTVTSAAISSNQPLVMTVNERGPGTISGTYVGLANGSNSVALPVLANGAFGFTTGTTILNTSSNAAHVTFTYLNQAGSQIGTPQSAVLNANASFQIFQGDPAQGVGNGFFGTALISSDQPLLVTTNALNTSNGLFYTYTESSM